MNFSSPNYPKLLLLLLLFSGVFVGKKADAKDKIVFQQVDITKQGRLTFLKEQFGILPLNTKTADSVFILSENNISDIDSIIANPEKVKFLLTSIKLSEGRVETNRKVSFEIWDNKINSLLSDAIINRFANLQVVDVSPENGTEVYGWSTLDKVLFKLINTHSSQLVYLDVSKSFFIGYDEYHINNGEGKFEKLKFLRVGIFKSQLVDKKDFSITQFPNLNHLEIDNFLLNYYFHNPISSYSEIKMIKEFPDDFFTPFKNLTEVIMSGNKRIPPSIFGLKNLKILEIPNNEAFEFDSLKYFPHLEKLTLGYVKTFPKSICSLISLKKLVLGLATPSSIPDEISNLQNLDAVALYAMPNMNEVSIFSFSDFKTLSPLKKLKSLTIAYNYYNKNIVSDSETFTDSTIRKNVIRFNSLENLTVDFALGYDKIFPIGMSIPQLKNLSVTTNEKEISDYGAILGYDWGSNSLGLDYFKNKFNLTIITDMANYTSISGVFDRLCEHDHHPFINSVTFMSTYIYEEVLFNFSNYKLDNLKDIASVTFCFETAPPQFLSFDKQRKLVEKKYSNLHF